MQLQETEKITLLYYAYELSIEVEYIHFVICEMTVCVSFLILMYVSNRQIKICFNIYYIPVAGSSPECKARIRKTRARNKWMVLYTLHKNPQLQCLRKKYLDEVKHSIIY